MDTKRLKTEEDFRRRAEKTLGKKIPENVWSTDRVKKEAQEALQKIELGRTQETMIRDFLDEIQSDLEYYKQERIRQGKREKILEEPDAVITDYELERAKAVAECLAKYLSARKEVRNFREEILEDRFPLSPEEADSFISSLAVGYAKRFDFSSDGISHTQHQTKLVEEKLERSDLIVRYLVESDDMSTKLLFEARFPLKERRWLDWVNEDLSFGRFGYCKESLLDETVTLANAIAQETRCDQQVAILFLLTGTAPIIPPIRISTEIRRRHGTYQQNKGSISMMIEPWVSAKSVMKTYQKLQQDLLGHHNHPMKYQNGYCHEIDVFLFVTQRKIIIPSENKNRDDSIVLPTWEKLAEAWNRIHPDRPRDRRTLGRDYRRAEQFMMLPSYR